MFDNPHLVRIEGTLHALQARVETLHANQLILLQRTQKIMASIDDVEADEAGLKTAITDLIHLNGAILQQLQALKNNPSIPPAVQAKIDDLHSKFTADLNDITSEIGVDNAAINPSPPGPLPSPSISGVDHATAGPGDQVTLTGSAFTGATGVSVGGVAVPNTDFHVITDSEIDFIVPPGGTDAGITVTTSQGTSNAIAFAYGPPQPVPQPGPQPSPAP